MTNSKPVVRRDIDSAGGQLTSGSPTVYINGHPVVRVGDSIAGHGIGEHSGPTMTTGSSSVTVDGLPVCRAGDQASCGHAASSTSNVFIGD